MQKAVNAKAEIGLQLSIMVWNTDFRCLKSYFFSNNTTSIVQTQEITGKNSHLEELKIKKVKSTFSLIAEVGKFLKQVCKKKKMIKH